MKTCTGCLEELPLESFAKKGEGKQARCRTCHGLYTKAHYQKNKSYYVTKARRNTAETVARTREYVRQYLSTHPCIDCGVADPRVLQFDHKDGAEKLGNISDLKTRSVKRVEAEIAKCEVRCANCHQIRTGMQYNWWNQLLVG